MQPPYSGRVDDRLLGTQRPLPFSLTGGGSHYEVVRLLAAGSMGTVYLARRTGIGGFARDVALKLAPLRYARTLFHEARILARLGHRNVVQAYDFGRAPDGQHYLAMELVHGRSVRAVLEHAAERQSLLPLGAWLSIGLGAAMGLAHAHDLCDDGGELVGLVHRDVSPSNLLLDHDGAVKVVDFGVAKLGALLSPLPPGPARGCAGYMAPECLAHRDVDHRSDVFSLGVVLYELATLRRAFPTSVRVAGGAQLRSLPIPPTRLIARFPPRIEEIIMTAMHPDPRARFQTADALRTAIEDVADLLGVGIGDAPIARTMAAMFGPIRVLDDGCDDSGDGPRQRHGPFDAVEYVTLEAEVEEVAR